MAEQRRKIWIDRLQTRLSVRIALYFLLYSAALVCHLLICDRIGGRLEAIMGLQGLLACILLTVVNMGLLAAVFIYDAVRFTHRLVGPLYRFRQTLKAVASGDEVELIRLRQGDLLLEMRDEFNDMLQALAQRGAVVVKPVEPAGEAGRPRFWFRRRMHASK